MHPFDQEGDGSVESLIDSFEQPPEVLLHRIDPDRSGLREDWQQSLLPEEHQPYLKSVLDTNADGLLDVLIASHPVNQGIEQQQIYLNDGTGPLNPAYTFRTNRQFRFFSDLDGNGLADAVFEDRAYGVCWSRSPGEFDEELIFRPGERAQELLAANFDNDRITDLVTWNRGLRSDPVVEPLMVRRGLGDGGFETVLLLPAPGGASLAGLGADYEAADLNSDGMLDLVARVGWEPPQTEIHVAYATSAFRFKPWRAYRVPIAPRSKSYGDFDGDQSIDLLVSNDTGFGSSQPAVVPVIIRREEWSIRAPIELAPAGTWHHVAVVTDIDFDRRADILYALSGNDSPTQVLVRRSGPGATFDDPRAVWTARHPQPVGAPDLRGFDHDGIEDVLLQTNPPLGADPSEVPRIRVLKGTGRLEMQTIFRDPDPRHRFHSAIADIDRDGQFDLISTVGPSLRLGSGDGNFGEQSGSWFEVPSDRSQAGDFFGAGSQQWIGVRQIGGMWWYVFSERRGRALDQDQAAPDLRIELLPASTTDGKPLGFSGRWHVATSLRDDCDSAPAGTILVESPIPDAPVLFVESADEEIRVYRSTETQQHAIVLRGLDQAASRARLAIIAREGGVAANRGQELGLRAHRALGPSPATLDDPLEPANTWTLIERSRFKRDRLDDAVRYRP